MGNKSSKQKTLQVPSKNTTNNIPNKKKTGRLDK